VRTKRNKSSFLRLSCQRLAVVVGFTALLGPNGCAGASQSQHSLWIARAQEYIRLRNSLKNAGVAGAEWVSEFEAAKARLIDHAPAPDELTRALQSSSVVRQAAALAVLSLKAYEDPVILSKVVPLVSANDRELRLLASLSVATAPKALAQGQLEQISLQLAAEADEEILGNMLRCLMEAQFDLPTEMLVQKYKTVGRLGRVSIARFVANLPPRKLIETQRIFKQSLGESDYQEFGAWMKAWLGQSRGTTGTTGVRAHLDTTTVS
jgi:hypothetical protein